MDKVKKIVAHFLKVEPSEIHGSTKIDYKSFSSSLMLHRMYTKLANESYVVSDPSVVVTFDDLLSQLSLHKVGAELMDTAAGLTSASSDIENTGNNHVYGTLEVGVDTEIIENFDFPADVRNDTFYKNTFSPQEIDYALQRANPRASFAALFSLKESIVKADNTLIGRPFNQIEISHTAQGKPFRTGFSLSVSHSDVYVVSIAIKTVR